MSKKLLLASILALFLMITNSFQVESEPKLFQDLGQNKDHEEARGTHRRGKLFSLFSVVQFKNFPCETTATISSGGRRRGTCFTASECASKGGRSQGACASGFGVCCLFLVSSSNSRITQNCTYIQNPGFPSPYSDSSAVTYTINKCSNDVCFLRLDFESFTLAGIGVTAGDGTDTCRDQFEVSVTSGEQIPIICGENSGQHIFIDLVDDTSDSATLSFTFADDANKAWDMKVTQYTCESENAPPGGCLQYHTGLTGQIKTFNYDLSNDNHLPNQRYSICIRQENGYCCVEYSVCPEEDLGFSLSTGKAAAQDGDCNVKQDFIAISDSSASCSQTPGGQLKSRYCGGMLSDLPGGSNVAICDCTPPHIIEVFTNNDPDDPTEPSKGICLEYSQIPCSG